MTNSDASIRRYHALDCARAAAMLLGVVYHALQFGGMSAGEFGPASGGLSSRLQDWLHSFRMPLFFLIAGFFCAMMLEKYGTWRYLRRRWARLGFPFVVALVTIVPLYGAIRELGGGPGPMGPPGGANGPPGRPGFGPGPLGPPGTSPVSPGGMAIDDLPPPPPGFVPPPLLGFDEDGDGSLSADEWKKALKEGPRPGGPGGFGPPGGGPFGAGPSTLRLDYLWFLWYLLVFVTISPAIAWAGGLVRRASAARSDALGRGMLRLDLAPLVLGGLTGPALLLTPGIFGWSLGPAAGIFMGFPEFLFRPAPDMPFYLAYFFAGWWLFRLRDGLGDVARAWFVNLLVGLVAHAGASALSTRFSARPDLAYHDLVRLGTLTLYAIGSAYTAFGALGFFLRFVDRPARAGRYLADTAFWVYLIHQPVLTPILRVLTPLGLPWWVQGATATVLTAGIALVLYELAVRPTPLVGLFGPAGASQTSPATAEGFTPNGVAADAPRRPLIPGASVGHD